MDFRKHCVSPIKRLRFSGQLLQPYLFCFIYLYYFTVLYDNRYRTVLNFFDVLLNFLQIIFFSFHSCHHSL